VNGNKTAKNVSIKRKPRGESVMINRKNVQLSSDVKQKLRRYGRFGDSYNDVIVKLLLHADSCDGFVEDWF
jgi:hypothetical protein